MALDRPGLFRTQIQALLRAAAGRELSLMIPMVSAVAEVDAAKALIERESELLQRRGSQIPERLRIGAMIEVPGILYELDALMPRVEFVSVGSNDLLQFLFAADRSNAHVASRYDALSVPALKVLKRIVQAAARHQIPLALCGEMAGRPLEAMALIGLGYRSISMAPASIGPVKTMILSLEARRLAKAIDEMLETRTGSLREELRRFAEANEVEVELPRRP
jgi:phosphotransferase system enzyme I (PtsP)